MKSTYKFFGMTWFYTQGEEPIQIVSMKPEILPYRYEKELLDVPPCARYITSSDLFQTNSSNDVKCILNKLQWCDTLYLALDVGEIQNPTVHRFIRKRIGQFYHYLKSRLQKTEILIAAQVPIPAARTCGDFRS